MTYTDYDTLPNDVLVADAGFLPTTRHIAIAVAERLSAYITPVAWRARAKTVSPPVISSEVARRIVPIELERALRRRGTGWELVRWSTARRRSVAASYPALWRRNVRVDKASARTFRNERLAIAQYGGAMALFERARALGGRTLLDYPIARYEIGMEILKEEAESNPEFAESLTGPDALVPSDAHLARIETELSLADGIVVGSRFAAESFAGVVSDDRIHVVPYGCDPTVFFPSSSGAPEQGPLRVLFVGQVTQRKGISYLLDAMAQLDPREVSLTVVGRLVGSTSSPVEKYGHLFRYQPPKPPADIPDVFRGADVLVLPSLVEGSAVVVYEAMASGLPVIVTPNAGADLVRDGVDGFVVPIRSAQDIAVGLERLRDRTLLNAMGAAARERALMFDWARFHKRLRRICVDLADGTPLNGTHKGPAKVPGIPRMDPCNSAKGRL